jgi:uncharacterized protein YndB with AHSA1/START domain
MPTLQEQILIAAPPEPIFAMLAQPERGPEWTPNLLQVERISPIEAGPGLETALVANVGGRPSQGHGRCVAWDPPLLMVLESALDVGVTSRTTFELQPLGAGTRLVARVEYTLPPKGLGKLVGSLLGDTLARRDLKRALSNLKQIVESGRA